MPALLGLPAVISWLGVFFTGIVGVLIKVLTVKLVFYGMVLASALAAIHTLLTTVEGLITLLGLSLPEQFLSVGYFLPSNTMVCLEVIFSIELASVIYALSVKIFKFKTTVIANA